MRNKVLTILLLASLPLVMMAYESPITEPGSENPTDMYTTTTGPNHAPGGPNKIGNGPVDPGNYAGGSPVGAPWILLGFAAAYAGVHLLKRGKKSVED